MAYSHQDKRSGELIRAADWNEMSREISRLGQDKVDRAGDTVRGPLKVTGQFSLQDGLAVTTLSNDATLGGNRDSALPTEQAVRGFVNAQASALTTQINGVSSQVTTLSNQTTNSFNDLKSKLAMTGVIVPTAGNAEDKGIMFPKNAAGGSGDAAWMRYYARSGEAMTLEIGISNDVEDQISLVASGGVQVNGKLSVSGALSFGSQTRQMLTLWDPGYGLGVQTGTLYQRSDKNFAWFVGGGHNDGELSAGGGTLAMYANNDRLHVSGDLYAGNSAIYFTKTNHDHSGIGNTVGYAAIENSSNFNTLMILGRTTGPGAGETRSVSIWDVLNVNGKLNVTGQVTAQSLKFGDGTTQSTATRVQGGRVDLGAIRPDNNGGNVTYSRSRIYYSGFTEAPTVIVSFARQDLDQGRNVRLDAFVESVTKDGCIIGAYAWADTIIYSVHVSWIAIGR